MPIDLSKDKKKKPWAARRRRESDEEQRPYGGGRGTALAPRRNLRGREVGFASQNARGGSEDGKDKSGESYSPILGLIWKRIHRLIDIFVIIYFISCWRGMEFAVFINTEVSSFSLLLNC